MTPSLVAALIALGFVAGVLFCWPLAYRSGKLKGGRYYDVDPDDEEWWNL